MPTSESSLQKATGVTGLPRKKKSSCGSGGLVNSLSSPFTKTVICEYRSRCANISAVKVTWVMYPRSDRGRYLW